MENDVFARLEETLKNRQHANPQSSYSALLFHGGEEKIFKKLNEECLEVVLAAKENDSSHLIYESADLLFHLLVLLRHKNIEWQSVLTELSRREGQSGIAEKNARPH